LRGGEITNDRRIRAALPSIRTVLDKDAKLVLLSHLGRPNGNGFQEVYSMKPVAERLGELLSQHVTLGPANVIGPELCRSVEAMNSGDILLLEKQWPTRRIMPLIDN
jgi:3-phosphoglycerate kinase